MKIEQLPTPVALRVTEDPCRCAGVPLARFGWLANTHWTSRAHYTWTCGKHALKRMVHLRALFKKQRAVFRPPSPKAPLRPKQR